MFVESITAVLVGNYSALQAVRIGAEIARTIMVRKGPRASDLVVELSLLGDCT
jgi:hypothetical protein